MKRLIFIILAIQSIVSYGQMFTITVKDAATKISLQGASVTILDKDSTFVDSCQMITIDMGDRKKYSYVSQIEGSSPYYYIQCEKAGYLPQVLKVDAADDIAPDAIMLKRAPRMLHEAIVTATKVMMVMKGDTIVYNADAFELAEGSMLDQLISRLPGVKLNAGGVITVNGNRVSSLLIDGKDFFNGDANVALENLPAYMVKKVKSYQKVPDNAYLTRKDTRPHTDDPWVIDVTLKKEYHQGWIANAEAGGGTKEKYLGRVFGTYFSDRARVGFYGNANNTNSNQRAGTDGKWENEDAMVGENTLQKGGIFASLYGGKNSKRPIRFTTILEASHDKEVNESRGNSVSFFESGNIFGKSMSLNKIHNYNLNWTGNLSIPTSFAYISLDQFFTYASISSNGTQQSANGCKPLSGEWPSATDVVNSYTDFTQDKNHSLSYSALLNATVKLPHDKELGVNFAANYNTTTDKLASLYNLLTQGVEPASDLRNRYNHNKLKKYQLVGTIDYALVDKMHGNTFHKLFVTYHIDHKRQQGYRDYYRFDRLGGDWALSDRKHLGQLPSTTDSLALATDWANTYRTTTYQIMHTAELRYLLMSDGLTFNATLPMAFTRNAIDDLRMKDQQRHIVKHYQWLQPSFSLSFKNINLSSSIAHAAPQMSLLLDVTDDSNPLFITKGNTTLKPTNIYNATLGYTLNKTKHAQNLNAELGYSAQQNAVGQARYYDAETGVTISMPQNLNGNWQTHVTVGYACSLDKKQKWTFDVSATETFQNSVDFQQTSLMLSSVKSNVKNWFTQGNIALAYHCKLFNAAFKSAVDWQHATSESTGFQTINSINHLYTFTNQWNLPWSMVIDTDLTFYVRSGYADHSMNRGEWIWNMAVTKRILKSKALSLKLSGHDILAQRSSVVRTLNAQGRTETWHNVVPRYFMLSIIYHFSKSPRKE
jgi:hypothetical protein